MLPGLLALALSQLHADDLSFNRDIRPILSANCFACHGPDKHARKADRRLDTREGALAELEGVRAIVPSDVEHSELPLRISSTDPDEIMPPPKSDKKLTPEQIATLKKWIAQGAKYEPHWSLIAPVKTALPERKADTPVRSGSAGAEETADRSVRFTNPIDAFIVARLEKEGLTPSPEAAPTALIRRMTFDLTGLPPTPAEVDAFLAESNGSHGSIKSHETYARLADRLLASPRYGERMTRDWLDLSRYADTHGYHLDSGRDMWLWRDWVIAAFNANMRYDQFTIEQIAGDLLPNATDEQKIATGFHRNAMINYEGGALAEEYLTQYVKDRVATTATVYLGLTLQCAECHDHKFDPVTQKEFYQMYAFFNAVPENGIDGSRGNAAPLLMRASPEQSARLAELQAAKARIDAEVKDAEQPAFGPALDKKTAAAKAFQARATAAAKAHDDFKKTIPSVMVMQQAEKPRESFVLLRGEYDKHGERVEPGVPASLPPLAADAPRNRLGLAQWLVDPRNPLVARVTVNRFWQSIMGTGIVKTSQDFGSQAEWPSHPELLDWLAVDFVESGWDVKRLVKMIVTSATYRQSARLTPELRARDPENRLHARGPRFRLGAEEIRDTALAVSGLLVGKIGGPSVRPYQPAGLWEELSSRQDSDKFSAQKFVQDHGESLYRRTMYTFWKRTSPPPSLTTFDAPDREKCLVSRERTNTPLQALVLMNDPTYLEAARKLAERMMTEGGASPAERIAFAFRLATARMPSENETRALVALFEKQRARFSAAPEQAAALLAIGESPRNEKLDATELAAWASVASTILNLDETVTKG